jgi:hypothetical protein
MSWHTAPAAEECRYVSKVDPTWAYNRSHARPQAPLATCRARPDLTCACSLHPDGWTTRLDATLLATALA